MSEVDHHAMFYVHLDHCQQCREHPFDLCRRGDELLRKAATEGHLFAKMRMRPGGATR